MKGAHLVPQRGPKVFEDVFLDLNHLCPCRTEIHNGATVVTIWKGSGKSPGRIVLDPHLWVRHWWLEGWRVGAARWAVRSPDVLQVSVWVL